jgi:S-layer protein (TIGR01567 family)
MSNEQITRVLRDDNTEMTITSDSPLKLEEGYNLALKLVDADTNKAYLELTKNGQNVYNQVIQPSKTNATMADKTYIYRADLGDTKKIVQIAVHFKHAFRNGNTSLATIDGVFQISDALIPLKPEQQYDNMSIRTTDPTAMTITMDNKDKQMLLSKNKDILLFKDIHIKTADQDATAGNPLRYYLYRNYSQPGIYDQRSTLADLGESEFTWTSAIFPGFFYDINTNIGTEKLTFRLSDASPPSAKLSDQPDANNNRGIVYATQAQPKSFKFKPWGQYEVIGFLGDKYFAAYDNVLTQGVVNANENLPFLFDRSSDRNLLAKGQLGRVLIDDNAEISINSVLPLKLKEDYELSLKYVNGTKACLELKKDGQIIDTKIIQPTLMGATMSDKTYYYKRDLGSNVGIVTIAVHLGNCAHGLDMDSATIDGIFQISETPYTITSDQKYGIMSIRNINPTDLSITLDNKDNEIALRKDKDIPLMGRIYIKTADQSDVEGTTPLRYYIYSREWGPALDDEEESISKKAGYALGIANESGRQGWVAEVKPESSIPLEDNESRKVLESAALAIESQDEKGFTELLSNETLRGVSGEPDLSSPEALKIAEGMKSAKFIGMAGDAVIYEMAIGNATYSFTTIKEEGVWKISGF